MLDYRYLKAFILTAEYSSFSKAAKMLNIAQSAVSRQIKLLEDAIGEELIIRSSKKVLLTHKGKELYLAAQQFDKVAMDIFQKEDERPLRVGILDGLLKNWFGPTLVKYYKKYNRNIRVEVQDQDLLIKGVEEGKFDMIFSTQNIQSELISSLKLFNEKLVLISKDDINKKKLHECRWIVYGEHDNLFKLTKKHSEQITQVEDIRTIVKLVRNNIGIAVVPDHVLKKNDTLKTYDMNGLPKSEIFMTTLNYKTMPSYIKEFMEFLG